MRAFATAAVAGVTGLVLLKLLATLVFPMLALFLGLMALTVKLGLIAAVVFFIFTMFRKRRDEAEA